MTGNEQSGHKNCIDASPRKSVKSVSMKQSAKAITFTGLVGAAALAGASQSYGAIVTVTPPASIPGSATNSGARIYYDVDTGTTSITQTSGSDLEFLYENTVLSGGGSLFETDIKGLNGGSAAAYLFSSANIAYAYNIPFGAKIGTGGNYAFGQSTKYLTFMTLNYHGDTYNSQLPENGNYFVGFQFKASDGLLHDGWVELDSETYTDAANPGGLLFLGLAYNTTPDSQGGTILAGQTAAVPEPGTLAALALGAASSVSVCSAAAGLPRPPRKTVVRCWPAAISSGGVE